MGNVQEILRKAHAELSAGNMDEGISILASIERGELEGLQEALKEDADLFDVAVEVIGHLGVEGLLFLPEGGEA